MKTDHVARVFMDRISQLNKDIAHYEGRIEQAEQQLSDDRNTLKRLADEKAVLAAELELREMQ